MAQDEFRAESVGARMLGSKSMGVALAECSERLGMRGVDGVGASSVFLRAGLGTIPGRDSAEMPRP